MEWKRLAVLMAFLPTLSCVQETCYQSNYPNYSNFTISKNLESYGGILFDDPKHELDYSAVIDFNTRVLECIKSLPELSPAELSEGACYGKMDPVIRSCLVVKVPEWHNSTCSNEQLFQCDVGNQPCYNKGLTPTAECPCLCRAMIQDNTVLLTTPNLRLYPAYLTSMLTGCMYPWTVNLAKCAGIK
jgi:hypothetical protein